jgi:cytochrome c oxidase subunit III
LAQHELSPEINEKVKKNLLKIFIFTVIMMFAGLTSAYLVMQGDRFWVNVEMPDGFKLGTISIFVSSGFLLLARYFVRKGALRNVKMVLLGALISGSLFGVFQMQGFFDLFASGNAVTGPIMTAEGAYGQYFSLTYEGKNITYDNDQFYLKGEPISKEVHNEIKKLGGELMDGAQSKTKDFDLTNYGATLMLYHEGTPVTYSNNKLMMDGNAFPDIKMISLARFGENMKNDRGDFIMQGKYGVDFWIYHNGKKLDYENRQFYIDGKPLSPKLRADLYSQQNSASSFIYAFTAVHLIHWIGGIIALLVVFIRGLKEKYTQSNYLGISLGSIYWHFLGILWLYLYLFLIYIH